MQGEGVINTIIFIITLSTVFPMIGYFLDYKHKKKMFRQQTPQEKQSTEDK